ncbi:ABC transporter permease [Pseudonocardia ailaonensis]|uniref:ABC transporter permease n=1 Tax=Pseudonocardia ailaonensis TaxID=367279 RepID=A0ABN2NFZ4_9PSEU
MNPATGSLLAETRRTPGRVVLTGLAILIATTFAAGTLLLTDALRTELTRDAVRTPEAAAFVVRGPADLARIRATPGVTDAVEVRSAFLSVRGQGTWSLESDPLTGPLTRLPALAAGRLPTGPGEALLGAATAQRTHLAPGARLTIGERSVTVTGIATLPGEGQNTLVTTPDLLAALGGELDQVDVAGTPDPAALTGPGLTVRTGAAQRTDEAEGASATVTAVLAGVSVFVGLALVAAVVVVASTFRIVLSRRRTQLALLRCVGATRAQVTRAVLAEAAVTGLVAGVGGVALATGLGAVLTAVIPNAPALVIPWAAFAGCVALAVVATLAAAAIPAIAAGRIPPVAALGTAGAADAGPPRKAPRIVLASLFALVAGGGGVLGARIGGDPVVGIALVAVSGLAAFAALIALGPLIVGLLARTLGRLGNLSAAGRMAVANARQVPRRTAATITVLALGVGLTSALLVGIAGVSAEADRSIAEHFPSAVVVQGADAAAAARLAADPTLLVRPGAGRADSPPGQGTNGTTPDQAAPGTTAPDGTAPDRVLVDPAPGTGDQALRVAVDRALGPDTGALVTYTADLRDQVRNALDVSRAVGFGLVGMTLLVAVVGVGVTLALSVAERTRETGLLRAVGLTRGGVRAMVGAEAAFAGAAAAVLGAVIGGGYGLLALAAMDLRTTPPIPWPELAALLVDVVVVAALAAVIPAARAARTPPTAALAEL